MKKSLLALAALTAFAGVASAQSSVTLFGVIDLNARNVKNGSLGSIKSLSTDGNASSRLGFRGVEDLGGGMRAGFWIEGGLAPDNGSAGGGNGGASATAMFNRRTTASLMGGFGEIRLGRDYVPTFWNHTVFDPFGTNGVGSQLNIIRADPTVAPFNSNAGLSPLGALAPQTLVRANNSIGYHLPAFGGLYGQLMVAAGENQVPANKYVGGRLGYAAGPVNVAGAYGKTYKDNVMVDDQEVWNVGGSFNLGFLTIFAQYHNYEYSFLELKNVMGGVAVPLGAGTLKASYGRTERTIGATRATRADRDVTQIAVGYVYDLSKRTALYTAVSRVDNDAGLAYYAGVGGPAIPLSPTTGGPTFTGFKSTAYEFGVRHSF